MKMSRGRLACLRRNIEDIKNNKQIYELIENREIQKVVFL